MDVKKARKIITKKFKDRTILSCYEYNNLYVFNIVPKTNMDKNQFDKLWSVNKTTGEVINFKPFDISIEDYKNGKRIYLKDLM